MKLETKIRNEKHIDVTDTIFVANMKILKWCERYLTSFIINGILATIFYVIIGCILVECHEWPRIFASAIG